ncbi:hypothetical protein Zm00014a_008020 [Zea mays]|uniref:Uncharacterized protein n=1 Tax=Zea mays TaxID=4577 RepID=A0A3L6FIL7_MAIZE|nr:hypothetical protein Zm00014a_008020 [Zea mays]
MWEPPALGLS